MSSTTLTLDAALEIVTAIMFTYAGTLILRRRVGSADARRATQRFSIWWFALAITTLLTAVTDLVAASGDRDLTTYRLLAAASLLPLVALLWGLVSYLAYIYSGSPKVFAWVTAFHLVMLGFFVWLVATLTPVGVKVTDFGASVDNGGNTPAWITAAAIIAILVPALVGAALYGSLYFRTHDRTARYRIGMTSGAFLLWFGVPTISIFTPLAQWYWFPLVSRGIGIVATIMIIMAYQPPRAIQERFGVAPVDLGTSSPLAGDAPRRLATRPLRA